MFWGNRSFDSFISLEATRAKERPMISFEQARFALGSANKTIQNRWTRSGLHRWKPRVRGGGVVRPPGLAEGS